MVTHNAERIGSLADPASHRRSLLLSQVQAALATLGDPASAGRVSHKLQQSAMISDETFAPDVFSLTLFLVRWSLPLLPGHLPA